MGRMKLNAAEYYRKVYGGWLGKNIGGTLGAPVEGKMELLDLKFYPILPDGPLENDDLDLQLVWLHALEQYGARLTAKELGQEWLEHVFFPFDEYGYALTNLRRGLQAPISGWFNNPFNNCMGSPIRSEIWAMVAPGAPHVAAYYAYEDAIVDHAAGEGVYGEVFFAAIESAAFVISDRDQLIQIGLAFIPKECRTAIALQDLLKWHQADKTWLEARELILLHHGHPNFTDAPQNIAFTILGWLYGNDFEDSILKAVNCGYDTDCTAATLAAILGIIGGPESLPERWVKPVGDRVVVSPPIKGFPAPQDLDELTRRTMRMGREVLAVWDTPIDIVEDQPSYFGDLIQWVDEIQADGKADLDRNVRRDRFLLPQGTFDNSGLELLIDYGVDGPVIGSGANKQVKFILTNHSKELWEGKLKLTLPNGWTEIDERDFTLECEASLEWNVEVQTNETTSASNELSLHIARYHDDQIWHKETVHFILVTAARWSLRGPDQESAVEIDLPGNAINFSELLNTQQVGTYYASSNLFNPSTRTVLLIAATAAPVKLSLNGKLLFEDEHQTEFMPAYHRAVSSKSVEFVLEEGTHKLEIEAIKQTSEKLEVYILAIAASKTKTPGSFYSYTDILFT
ncbi:ADP-ribosylglycohydrolase family protein [Paenibacillus psychroresistens]|uniref:ADP-ribosylglycohydrolase family protein n=1 Tax=Paenibacillus psychroresistens TaxID=1778678 RepID=A0A6B8RIJ0_9BACL|nr:ADP-ribosylglycohydrolase family protein [Paenibacillus psychroresistens]QGQ95196.1 ADP-ribosylglycohydrolase family protein [Paenibacillus psychroresistens]